MKKGVALLIILAVFFSAVTAYFSIYQISVITGHVSTGGVNLFVTGAAPTVIIYSPLNTTYNFAIGSNLTLYLNVSSQSEILTWSYKLEDLTKNIVKIDTVFNPNVSFNAARRSNRLTVYATDSVGQVGSASVIFYVFVPNSAPILGNISSELYVCESDYLHEIFNATDVDEESLITSISPTDPFFVFPNTFYGSETVYSEIFTSTLTKSQVGKYNRTVSVTDGQYSDSKNTSITVIEINNPPVIEEIGVQTIYIQGTGKNLEQQVWASDIEDGSAFDGNLEFNISFNGGPELFDVNDSGYMYLESNSSYLGTYDITVCATDNGLPSLSDNSSLCFETGESKYACENFSLTVTDQNRPPTIIDYTPEDLNLVVMGDTLLTFNITTFDPDETIPDVYWYLNNVSVAYESGSFDSDYSFIFPCGVSGIATVEAEITDGLENDSITWSLNVTASICPTTPSSSSGGGGGNVIACSSQWGCNDWRVCQHTDTSLELGIISREDYREISQICLVSGLDSNNCGFQTRTCFDNNFCNSTRFQPDLIQACQFVSNPSCNDGLKNCHDGSCELLIDCGGPCNQCPSCSDGISNQGELGIDCGGPCPFVCPAETPFVSQNLMRTIFIWLFWLFLIILLIILIRKLIKLIEVHRELQKEKKIQSALSK